MKFLENTSRIPIDTPTTIAIVLAVIAAGIILTILTGFTHIRKGSVAIIEKTGVFVGIFRSGWHFFTPLTARRVGMYKLGENVRKVENKNDEYIITYEIEDIKKFHYEGHHDVESVLRACLNDRFSNLGDALTSRLNFIGIKFIKLEKVKKEK